MGDWTRTTELAFAERILLAQARAVEAAAQALSGNAEGFHQAAALIEACARAEGTVLVSGLGKSGLIGAKISATLASLGITSHFVHPSEAAHGDLGRFRASDLCIALSASGETDEVVALAAMGFAGLMGATPSTTRVAHSTPAAEPTLAEVAPLPGDRPLSEQIAEARPGATLMLAKATLIETSGTPLRLSKRLRIEVGAPLRN